MEKGRGLSTSDEVEKGPCKAQGRTIARKEERKGRHDKTNERKGRGNNTNKERKGKRYTTTKVRNEQE